MLCAPSPRTADRRAPTPRPVRRIRATALSLLATGGLLVAVGGCGVPPEVRNQGSTVPAAPASATATAAGTPAPAAPGTPTPPVTRAPTRPSATGFSEFTAAPCAGRPSGDGVLDLLRRASGLLTAQQPATVTTGPLCAGSWQYTVVTAPGHEPLQVVSRGPADALALVTAGTDVCAAPVRSAAPAAIRNIACNGIPPAGPGL